MIQVRITKQDKWITDLRVSGHAESADYGQDLVCAAVSGIMFGLCNALNELSDVDDIIIEDNVIRIHIAKPDLSTNLILNTGVIQLKTVEESKPQFVKVQNTEANT